MSARTDLCGGYQATGIPTVTGLYIWLLPILGWVLVPVFRAGSDGYSAWVVPHGYVSPYVLHRGAS